MAHVEPASLTAGLLTEAAIAALFSPRATVQAMLDVEAALARAEAGVGLIPPAAAAAIDAACDAARYDLEALNTETIEAGNPAIPLVRALTAAVKRDAPEAAGYVHWGTTSQDIVDTAMVLQMRAAIDVIEAHLDRIRAHLGDLARHHRATPMAARTLLQQALPTTFGLKAACWLAPIQQCRHRLIRLRNDLPVQLGGAAGTLASLGGSGTSVARALAREFGLRYAAPWHTDRTPVAETASALGLLTGSLGKAAGDMLLMSQTEIAELVERAPGGGSSTLPHKRNPVALIAVAAAAQRAPGYVATLLAGLVQQHERAAGAWHAEWDGVRDLFVLAGAACEQMAVALSRIEVDTGRMRHNLDATRGLVMAEAVAMSLAGQLGRGQAHALVKDAAETAAAEGLHLRDALAQHEDIAALLDAKALDALFDPLTYLGEANAMIDHILAEG